MLFNTKFDNPRINEEYRNVSHLVFSFFEPKPELVQTHLEIIHSLPQGSKIIALIPLLEDNHSFAKHYKAYKKKIEMAAKKNKIEIIFVESKFETTEYNFIYHGNWGRDFISPMHYSYSNNELTIFNFKYALELSDKTDLAFQEKIQNLIKLKFPDLKINLINLPFFFEGGNLLSTHNHIFISNQVFEFNKNINPSEIKKTLTQLFSDQQIIWLPKLDFEQTGHVDLYIKPLNDESVLVAKTNLEPWKTQLDIIADQIQRLGYKIERVDLALFEDEKDPSSITKNSFSQYKIPFRSYTNTVFFKNLAFVPKYSNENDYSELQKYDDHAKIIFEKLGYKVIFLDSITSIECGGSVHCLISNVHLPL